VNPQDPYRHPTEAPSVPPDDEALALGELARRARRTRLAVSLPMLVAAIVAGVALYVALRALFIDTLGGHVPYLTGALSMAPPIAVAWSLALRVSRRLVEIRSPSWIAELSARHQVAREMLEDLARSL
jgi:hypothetical protein